MSEPEDRDGPALPPHLDPRRGRPSSAVPRVPRGGKHALPPRSSSVLPPARSRGRRFARALSFIALGLSLTVLVASGVLYGLYRHYDGQIDRIPFSVPGTRPDRGDDGEARNILLVGSDTREGEGNEAYQSGPGQTQEVGQRSDTVILAHLYGDSDKAQLVSFPRDAYVTIPAHTDVVTGEQRPSSKGKLNAAIGMGGPGLLIATIEGLTDIKVDHYVQIDFAGFQAMVEALGGVEVCLSEPAKEKDSGIDLPAGRQTIRGEQALAFVRQRKELPGGDLGRIRRQQQFIGAVVRKVLSAGTLLNPVKLNGFLNVATRSVDVDEDLGPGQMRDLAQRLRGFDAGGVIFTTVPVAEADERINGQSFVILDETGAGLLFRGLRDDVAPTPPPPAPTAPLIVRPASVRVMVYNGAGVSGLGRRAAADLERVGFAVVGVPENRGAGVVGTEVRHGPGREDSARTLVAALPGATAVLDPALDRTLEVVVGSGYAGTVPVVVQGDPAPVPSAPPVTTAAEDVCAA